MRRKLSERQKVAREGEQGGKMGTFGIEASY